VVELRTGKLRSHDPDLLMTKITGCDYIEGARHPDWDKALEAIPVDVRGWLCTRYGQGITGYLTPDDVMVVQYGSGSNGKSSVFTGIAGALGDYHRMLSDRVILANPQDHPTELMDLRGCRLAIIEETPESRRLNVQRLKKVLGTHEITARHIRKDSVTFATTHTLILSTNYKPVIEESDHGTWRRLALVRYPYQFCTPEQYKTAMARREGADDGGDGDSGGSGEGGKDGAGDRRRDGESESLYRIGDPGLRDRLTAGLDGRREAVLAWLVDGARAWYEADRVMPAMPERVREATRAWRADSDSLLAYLDDRIEFEYGYHVTSADLLVDLNAWLEAHGHRAWSYRLLGERLANHDEVVKNRIEYAKIRRGQQTFGQLSRPEDDGVWTHLSAVPNQYHGWLGMRFVRPEKTDQNDLDFGPGNDTERS
jgi:putative DNA primase/helicase